MTGPQLRPHHSHWGAFSAALTDGGAIAVRAHPEDPAPSAILGNVPDSARNAVRVDQPMVRRGWLERGPGPSDRRGADPFVAVEWDEALELVARELARVRDRHGAQAIYGGSYGWGSAGRFHHAQSQIHRFLSTIGGFTRSVNTYSGGASAVILPHVLAPDKALTRHWVLWPAVAEHAELIVAFGGMAIKNAAVAGGGPSRHTVPGDLARAAERGCELVLASPIRDDLPAELGAEWLPLRPATDVALMLGIAHTLVAEGLHDREFLARCTTGWAEFERYVRGETDGIAKTPAWASAITEIDAAAIARLARRMAGRRTLITVSHSLQRAEHGEQPVWMGLTLAAMLGHLGLDGGGFAYSLGSLADVGRQPAAVSLPSVPHGRNPVDTFIPVARVADMLLHPGEEFDYDGRRLTYPDIRLVYWAGGNPFHHHQDLHRLRRAFGRPDTIVVHDSVWTATARHADVVLPATITLEREDIGASGNDDRVIAMHRIVAPFAQARDDYAIFAGLADRLGRRERFTEGRTAWQWVEHLYEQLRTRLAAAGAPAPPFDEFWEVGEVRLPMRGGSDAPLRRFRSDPEGHPLPTPSGRIEITSATIAGFGYDDCPGHPAWLEPVEYLGAPLAARFPLQLVANQPAGRLHSQLDFGAASRATKVAGREPIRIHPADAAARGIEGGDVVRVFNDRGACLAGAVVSDAVRPGVVQLSTGAWHEPLDPADPASLCVHGNPNVLTRDAGTSRLAQGCAGQLTLVDVERMTGDVPPSRPHLPPPIIRGRRNA